MTGPQEDQVARIAAALRETIASYHDNRTWTRAAIVAITSGDMGQRPSYRGIDIDDFATRLAARLPDSRVSIAEPSPKPDGWHTYHICGGLLRELVWSGPDATCHHCGQWLHVDVREGPAIENRP